MSHKQNSNRWGSIARVRKCIFWGGGGIPFVVEGVRECCRLSRLDPCFLRPRLRLCPGLLNEDDGLTPIGPLKRVEFVRWLPNSSGLNSSSLCSWCECRLDEFSERELVFKDAKLVGRELDGCAATEMVEGTDSRIVMIRWEMSLLLDLRLDDLVGVLLVLGLRLACLNGLGALLLLLERRRRSADCALTVFAWFLVNEVVPVEEFSGRPPAGDISNALAWPKQMYHNSQSGNGWKSSFARPTFKHVKIDWSRVHKFEPY